MSTRRFGLLRPLALALAALSLPLAAAPPTSEPEAGEAASPAPPAPADPQPAMASVTVLIVDDNQRPVADAKVTPWALRSSLGHGWWGNQSPGLPVGPKTAISDAEGHATIEYPIFHDPAEKVRTTGVTLNVDHSKFASLDFHEVKTPVEDATPQTIPLTPGIPVIIRPRIEGEEKIDLETIAALWSDGRSWRPGNAPEKLEDGRLRLPPMRPGANSVLLIKLDGDRTTHFSRIVDFQLAPGVAQAIDVPLRPAMRIGGTISDNVPRPVRQGRISLRTLPPDSTDHNRVSWHGWTSIGPNGAFVIEAWPEGEPLQVTALCDGYIARSGTPPAAVKNPPDAAAAHMGIFTYPQVFEPGRGQGRSIEVPMLPLVRCIATVRDPMGRAAPGVKVVSWPNVLWWNSGSQLYCHPLLNGRKWLRERDYRKAADEAFPQPFQGVTDARGQVTLELPSGQQSLVVDSDTYELPVKAGSRDVSLALDLGQVTEVELRLQPRGTDHLGK